MSGGSTYWLFTPEMLEAALDQHLDAKLTAGVPVDQVVVLGSEIREFLIRGEATANHGLRIEPSNHLPPTRGTGVTG